MAQHELEQTARALIAEGKGILAADETVPTITKRFAALKIESTQDSRRAYREMFFTTPDVAEFISGVILQDETIRQKNPSGIPLAEVLSKQGIIPGIKVDSGAKVLAGSPEETMTLAGDGAASAGPGAPVPGSKTPALDQFTMNLTERAKK